MEHQYPGAISGDEHMLAELMLPDQTHVRSQDWTIFFLHKDTSSDEEDSQDPNDKGGEGGGSGGDGQDSEGSENLNQDEDDEEDDGEEGPPLMYVLNLVNTKQDNTAKR
jgi:hypothetical protein